MMKLIKVTSCCLVLVLVLNSCRLTTGKAIRRDEGKKRL